MATRDIAGAAASRAAWAVWVEGAASGAGASTGASLVVSVAPATVFNARVGFGRSDGRWMLELWGTNLTDEDYVQVGFDGPLQGLFPDPNNPLNTFNAFLGAPRMYGMTLRVRY